MIKYKRIASWVLAGGLCILPAGCGQTNPAGTSQTRAGQASSTGAATRANPATAQASAPVAGEKPGDAQITADIRKKVAEAISPVDAANVKIVTRNGEVTLSGHVETKDEKRTIENLSAGVAGAGNVKDQLAVAAK